MHGRYKRLVEMGIGLAVVGGAGAVAAVPGTMPVAFAENAVRGASPAQLSPNPQAGRWLLFLPDLRLVRPVLTQRPLASIDGCTADRFMANASQVLLRDVDVDSKGNLFAATSMGAVALMADGRWAHWPDSADSYRDEANLSRIQRVVVDGRDRAWFGQEIRFTFQPRINAADRAIVIGGLWFLDPQSAEDPLQWTRHVVQGRDLQGQGPSIGPVTAMAVGPNDGVWSAQRQGLGGSGGIAGFSWRIDAAVARHETDGALQWINGPCPVEGDICLTEGARQIAVTRDGDLWMVQPGVGLRLRLADGSWPTVVGGKALTSLQSLALDAVSGELWLAGDRSGTLLRGVAGGRWVTHRLPKLPNGEPFPPPLTMAVDRRGNLWLASGQHAAVRWRDGHWTLLSDGGVLDGGPVVRAWSDRQGDVWLDHDAPDANNGLLRVRCW